MIGEPYVKKEKGVVRLRSQSLGASGADAYTAPYGDAATSNIAYENSLTGIKNPAWRSQIEAGIDATTNMSAVKTTVDYFPGHLEVKGNVATVNPVPSQRRAYGEKGYVYYAGFSPSGDYPVSAAANSAAGAFYAKVRNVTSICKGLVALGEAKQATRMIRTRGEQILKGLSFFTTKLTKAKRRWRRIQDLRKALADHYLETVFGWGPLVGDIQDALEAAKRIRPIRRHVKGDGVASFAASVLSGTTSTGIFSYDTLYRDNCTSQVRYYSWLTLEQGVAGTLADFGLTTREFVPTLYEIMPWSFLLDYFGNLNEIINAGCYASLVNGQVNMIVRNSHEQVYSASGAKPNSTVRFELQITDQPSRVIVTTKSVQRTAGVGLPMVYPAFKMPTEPKKLINMAALYVARRYKYWP